MRPVPEVMDQEDKVRGCMSCTSRRRTGDGVS